MTLREMALSAFSDLVKKGGKLAGPGHGGARIEVCKTRNGGDPCEFFGEVEPVPGLKTEGCIACGCPFATKPHMLTILGKNIECPHPDGNMWAEVDNNFKTKNLK